MTVTDALDMRALAQGSAQIVDAVAALRAGEDVLLGTADEPALERLEEGLAQARRRGLIDADDDAAAEHRLGELRRWLGRYDQPPLDVVGCGEHQALAAELARRSITLVRNDDRLVPLTAGRRRSGRGRPVDARRPDAGRHVLEGVADAGIGAPTPARRAWRRSSCRRRRARPTSRVSASGSRPSTSSSSGRSPRTSSRRRRRWPWRSWRPGKPTVTVALRTPWDLLAYPSARTHVCSYGILPPSMEALAGALLGEAPFVGRLPVDIDGLHPRGHGLTSR